MQRIYLALFGNLDAFSVGECYHHGRHVEKNLTMARRYYLLAGNTGNVQAYRKLSLVYVEMNKPADASYCSALADLLESKWIAAKNALKRAATPEAFYKLACLYQSDRIRDGQIIIKKNRDQELHWLRKAAQAFSAPALDFLEKESLKDAGVAMMLANMYWNGEIGWTQKPTKALEYFFLAASNGCQEALTEIQNRESSCQNSELFQLAEIHQTKYKDLQKSFRWLIKLANKNYLPAVQKISSLAKDAEHAYLLGVIYESNNQSALAAKHFVIGCRKDHEKSFVAIVKYIDTYDDKNKLELASIFVKYLRFEGASLIYKKLADIGNGEGLTALEKLTKKRAECAYIVAKAYEAEDHIGMAYYYYLKAAEIKNYAQREEILHRLKKEADTGFDVAQYYYGCLYLHKYGSQIEAVDYAIAAAEQNHDLAKKYLNNTSFTAATYFYIAKRYEAGDRAKKNVAAAIEFYQKAVAMKHKDAEFDLAELYFRETELVDHIENAITHYAAASRMGHSGALARIRELAEVGYSSVQFIVGREHHKEFSNESLLWIVRAAEQNYTDAMSYLESSVIPPVSCLFLAEVYAKGETVKKNIHYAHQFYVRACSQNDANAMHSLAEFYLQEGDIENNVECAIDLLIKAVKQDHEPAMQSLVKLANEGHSKAQYYLGCEHSYRNGPTQTSLRFAMMEAERGNILAIKYLDNTSFSAELYIYLADTYAKGQEVRCSIPKAVQFYSYAIRLNNAEAAFKLGEFYFVHAIKMEDGLQKAIQAFVTAAQLGHGKAVETLEKFALEGNVYAQFGLGCEYFNFIPNNMASIHWAMLAADRGYEPASNFLDMTVYDATELKAIAKQYAEGNHVKQNLKKAIHFYRKASKLDDPESALEVAKLYLQINDIENALTFFEQAQRVGILQAEENIKKLADFGFPCAQYRYSQILAANKKYVEAIDFAMLAADQGEEEAKEYLDQANFPAELYRKMAARYAVGDGVKADVGLAISIYQKAIHLFDAESAYNLGMLYLNINVNSNADNIEKAIPHLISAARWKHNDALAKLIELAQEGNASVQYYLALEIYHKQKLYSQAIDWALKAEKQGHAKAKDYLETPNFPAEFYLHLAKKYETGEGVPESLVRAIRYFTKAVALKDAESAYQFGEFYLAHPVLEDYKKKAYFHIAKAALWGNAVALAKLEMLAKNDDADAQYFLGCEYHHHRPARFEAIRFAMQAAEQGQADAQAYLDHTLFTKEIYRHIGKKYAEFGDTKNAEKAIKYFAKAIALNDMESAVQLAELLLVHNEFEEHKSEAFITYVKAVQLGHKDSLTTLECLANDVDPQLFLSLGDVYRYIDDDVKAVYWYQQAMEAGYTDSNSKRYLSKFC